MTLPPWYIPDTDGTDLRPDPDTVATVAGLAAAMRAYLIWEGNPSFRDLSARCRHRVGASTFCTMLKGDVLPRLDVVRDFIGACGVTEEYRERFEDAWRRLATGFAEAGNG